MNNPPPATPDAPPSAYTRLELVWANKDKYLLSPHGDGGKPVWVDRDHPHANEIRLTHFAGSVGDVNARNPYADNLIFTGDSIDVLRVLTQSPEYAEQYRGKVKLVYIDPPFNTGQTFKHYDDWMEHSTWLSFMKDRVALIRDLLAPDGSVWVHLDDAETHRMRCLLDEVFGAGNFVAQVVWEKKKKPSYLHGQISTVTDNILIYGRERKNLQPFAIDSSTANKGIPFHNAGNSWGKIVFPAGSVTFGVADGRIDARDMSSDSITSRLLDDVDIRGGTNLDDFRMEGEWRFSQKAILDMVIAGDAITIARQPWRPNLVRTEVRQKKITNVFSFRVNGVPTNEDAKAECRSLFSHPEVEFDTPKPEGLLERIIESATRREDIVLDVFGGSGTTSAVAQKMGRRWITAELNPNTVKDFIVPRLTKVVAGDDPGGITEKVGWTGGGGFRTVTIGESMFVMDDGDAYLDEWCVGEDFRRAVAGQLGYIYTPGEGVLCGRRGYMRLAVFDGTVGVEEAQDVVERLGAGELVTIVGAVILPGVELYLQQVAFGSQVLKSPRDILVRSSQRRSRTRNPQ